MTAINLVIAETGTSTQHYHLRHVGPAGLRLGGGLGLLGDEGRAICGAVVGWDTKISLAAWNMIDAHSHWCRECDRLKGRQGP